VVSQNPQWVSYVNPNPAPQPSTGPAFIAGIAGTGVNSYFVDQNSQPRFHLLEEPWLIHANGGRWGGTYQTDMDGYLTARAAQGYTAIVVAAFGSGHWSAAPFNDGRTWDGVPPFLGGNNIPAGANPGQLNNTFWTRFDYLFNKAKSVGISVFLNLGLSYNWSDGTAGSPSVWYGLTDAQAQAFGTAIATRYPQSQYPNVFWFRNDDSDGSQDQFHEDMTTGILAAGDTRPAGACEYFPETTSHVELDTGAVYPSATSWGQNHANWNWVYTYDPCYLGVERAYTDSKPVMVLWADGPYYGDTDNSTADYTIRRFCWWALASGARGINATNGPTNDGGLVWMWQNGALAAVTTSDPNGPFCRVTVGTIVSYFTSLPGWYKLIADTGNALVTAGRGTRSTNNAPGFSTPNYGNTDNYVAASRVSDGSLAVIYCGQHFSITIDQTKMQAGYAATWVDPVTCATTSTSTGSSYSSTGQGNNSAGNPDWALVLHKP
jgi:hypothetical protein